LRKCAVPQSDLFVFCLIAAAMTAVALAFVLPYLFARRPPPARAQQTALNAAIVRGELAELDHARAEGLVTDAQYTQARTEIERRFLADTVDASESGTPRKSPRVTAVAVAVALPVLAFVLYALFGDPAVFDGDHGATSFASAVPGALPAERDALVRHLSRQPRDGRGWVMLARIDFAADRFAEAARAYGKAIAASPRVASDAGVWCEYADALGMAQGGTLAGEPRELVLRALALDAAHPKALEMAGSAAYEQHDYAAALRYWRQLFAQLPERSPAQRELAAAIARAEQMNDATVRSATIRP
jgi:cytochrome c-type biogenesis protein CcmH